MLYSELYARALESITETETDPREKALEVQILMERAFHLNRTRFWITKRDPVTDQQGLEKFYCSLERLKKGEPLAYIIGEKPFFDSLFYVNEHVLIPRADTELLVEKALAITPRPVNVLEIGAGCGNIAISIARRQPVRVVATEKSLKALAVLKKNIARYRLGDQVTAIQADMFPDIAEDFDLIISNPPYISEKEWKELPLGIRDFEPRMALVGGSTGTEIMEKIIAASPSYLKSGGSIMMEIGYNQRKMVGEYLKKQGFGGIRFHPDINRIHRVVSATR